jgi:hypothetical protein
MKGNVRRLRHLAQLERGMTGDTWHLARDEAGHAVVELHYRDGHRDFMRVTRDETPARDEDVDFIAHARADIKRLVAAFDGVAVLSKEELSEIATRLGNATPAPWQAFLESDGGLGGDSMIAPNDPGNPADLYLWNDAGRLAPDPVYEFIAAVRNELPDLVAAALLL